MEIPYRSINGKISPSLTFLGDDSTERRSSLSLPVSQEDKIVELHDPIDAVSCNKHQDRIVCAGSRGVLRVFKVTDRIIPELDLKKVAAKNKNRTPLLYSPSNVAWSKLRDDLIATTSTIGAVVLWNIDQQRTEIHWKAHTRSATVVRFHRYNENILISGSKDGCIVYDTRESTPVLEFRKRIQETVRDLTFSLIEGDDNTFLSADDGGIIKVWDLRNNAKPCYSRTLHDGYISCIQSHPKRPYEVASGGGRDKLVKIWNWKMNSTCYKHVETYAPVGRINWRPDNEFQFATCAVFTDVSVQVWDTRRPHLPMVSYPGHKDSTTDVFWSRFDPHRFVSVGKDGLAILHNVSEGDWTIDHLCDAQVDIAPDGLMVIGVNSENEMKKKPNWELATDYMQLNKGGTERRREAVARHLEKRSLTGSLPVYEPFSHYVKSEVVVGVPSAAQFCLSSKLFEKYARFWIMGGKSIVDMCEYNAVVCAKQGDEVRERTWRYVAGLMEEAKFQEHYDEEKAEGKVIAEKKWRRYILSHEAQGTMPYLPPEPKPDLPFEFLKSMSDVRLRDGPERIGKKDSKAFQFLASLDVEHEFIATDANMLKSEEPHGDEFCGLPEEAFGMKRYFQDVSSIPLTERNSWRTKEAREVFTPISLLIKALHFIAHQGDIQMCASIATVAGRKLSEKLSDYFIEAWVQSYMDMLYRLEMYEPIASLRKFTCVKRLNEEANEGIFVRPLITHARENPAWGDPVLMRSDDPPPGYIACTGKLKNGNCEKCAEPIQPTCVVCDQIIEGVLFNCERCNHSMHLDHAFGWFRTRIELVDPDNLDRPNETIRQRRARLMNDEETDVIDRTQHKCPVPGCRCKCLEEDEDEREEQLLLKDETAGKVDWESIVLYRTKHIESKYKKKKESMEQVENRIKKKMNLSKKFEIVFSKSSYDFEPAEKHKKTLETLKAAVKTPEEEQLYSLVKSCLAIPPELSDKVRQEVFGLPSDDDEEDEDTPLVVRFGLTTMEKVREYQEDEPELTKEEKRSEMRRVAEQKAREATDHWYRVWEKKPKSQRKSMRRKFFSQREREIDDYRRQKAPQCDVIRCISWGLIRRIYRVEKRREKKRLATMKDQERKFKKIMEAAEEKKRPDMIRKFIANMREQSFKEHRSSVKFKEMMKNTTMHMSGMVNFITMRVKPCFVKKHGRLTYSGSKRTRHRLDWNENIAKVYRIHPFEIRERKKVSEPYYPPRPEPTGDLIPNTHDDIVRALKINAARITSTSRTTVSSGPMTPRTTIDFQI